MKVRMALKEGDVEALRQAVMDAGVYYVVPPRKSDRYQGQAVRSKLKGKEVVHYGSLATGTRIEKSMLPCPGVLEVEKSVVDVMRDGLRQYFRLVLFSIGGLEAWLNRYVDADSLVALEFKQYLNRPGTVDRFFPPGSLIRADIALGDGVSPKSCDPNVMPLGMAFYMAYAQQLSQHHGVSLNGYAEYISGLRTAVGQDGFGGIVTGTEYSNWHSHAVVASQVAFDGTSFFVIPPDCITQDGSVDGSKLRSFYETLGLSGGSLIPNKLVEPTVLVRHVREYFRISKGTRVINPPGIQLVGAHLFQALPWMQGIEEFDHRVDINRVRECVAPSMICRVADGELYIATGIYQDELAGDFRTNWEPYGSISSYYLVQWLFAHAGVSRKTAWFVKKPYSSGKKQVRLTGKTGITGADAHLTKAAQQLDVPEGYVFLAQPAIPSTFNQNGTPQRAKMDLYFTGPKFRSCGADMMVVPMNQLAVHGGSDTDYWLVDCPH